MGDRESPSTRYAVDWALPAPSSARRAGVVAAGALLLVGLVGLVDVATGRDVTLSPLYLLAVIVGSWRGGRWVALATAAGSALAGLVADLLLSEPYLHLENSYSSGWIPFWNTVARALVFVAAALAVSTLQALLRDRDQRARELERALAEIRILQSLLPMCAWCRKIRDEADAQEWKTLERYVAEHTDTAFTHGICPDCAERVRSGG